MAQQSHTIDELNGNASTTVATETATKTTRKRTKRKAGKKIRLDPEQSWFAIERDESTFDLLRRTEWLLTDGLGGYSMGTALGLNTRRYHGVFIHAARSPLGRIMMVNALHERIIIDPNTDHEKSAHLTIHEFHDGTVGPGAFESFVRFEKGLNFCRWTWQALGVEVERELRLNFRTGGIKVLYRLHDLEPTRSVALEVRPLMRLADHHKLRRAASYHRSEMAFDDGVIVTASSGETHVTCEGGTFTRQPQTWYNFKYVEESVRGQDDIEDLYTPGYFRFAFTSGEKRKKDARASFNMRFAATPDQLKAKFAIGARAKHLETATRIMQDRTPKIVSQHAGLIAAADDFVVPRRVKGRELKTILAGYPWFSDWGRDTAIALPGLLLTTGRYEEALETLRAFADHRRGGLIPNVFDDQGGAAHYNTVDASLWFCQAACEYVRTTGDRKGFQKHLHEACIDILAHYQHGTEFNIKMDPDDGLIMAGDESTQLTWMDARRDGVTFTPRHGKAVEINALWYHDLLAVADAIESFDEDDATRLRELAKYVGPNLRELFWCDETGCLYDCVFPQTQRDGSIEWIRDPSIRPNQLIAVSLRHCAFNERQQKSIVKVCEDQLLTPVGMRTLSPNDPKYRPRFEGDMFNRDSAYHQGTVWPWLMGPFIEALLRSENATRASVRKAKSIVKAMLEEMQPPSKTAGFFGATSIRSLGQLFEVYDGDDSPHRVRMPGGCMAQAWSVAEPLRVLALIERLESGDVRFEDL